MAEDRRAAATLEPFVVRPITRELIATGTHSDASRATRLQSLVQRLGVARAASSAPTKEVATELHKRGTLVDKRHAFLEEELERLGERVIHTSQYQASYSVLTLDLLAPSPDA